MIGSDHRGGFVVIGRVRFPVRRLLTAALLVVGCGEDRQDDSGGAFPPDGSTGEGSGGTSGGDETDGTGGDEGDTTGAGSSDASDGGGSTGGDASTTSGDGGHPPNHSAGCGEDPPATPLSSVSVSGQQRTFILDLPAGYSSDVAYPLVFGWHGTNHQGANAKQQMRLLEASGNSAVVVYPNGGQQAPVWEFPGGVGVTDPLRDIRFFDAMVEALGDAYCLDGERIFSTGFSQGAFLSNALGCARPWALRGIAPVAGGGPWQCDPAPLAAMIVVGSSDPIAHEDGDYGYENSAQRSRDFWLQGGGCGATTTPVDPSPCVAYDCPAETPVHFCEFAGGHQWWSAASQGMWAFFSGL
jgi:poly(3-hydroxybutyrate) depolymerase